VAVHTQAMVLAILRDPQVDGGPPRLSTHGVNLRQRLFGYRTWWSSGLAYSVIDGLRHTLVTRSDRSAVRTPSASGMSRTSSVCTGRCSERLCFVWTEGGAEDVELVDHHRERPDRAHPSR
jgi:hypothetical protein